MKYEDYMVSMEWVKRRDTYFEDFRRECLACMARQGIELHHRSYTNLGHEPDEDLAPLCARCHERVHKNLAQLLKSGDYTYELALMAATNHAVNNAPRRRQGMHHIGGPIFYVDKRFIASKKRCRGCGWWLLLGDDGKELPCGRCPYEARILKAVAE